MTILAEGRSRKK